MNKTLIALFLIVFVTCKHHLNEEEQAFKKFQKFIKKYNKKYHSIEEYLARYQIFKTNMQVAYENQDNGAEFGITKFSDLTEQEFRKTYLNLNFGAHAFLPLKRISITPSNDAPESYDWRDVESYVTAVKDQGSCGSCWAFSTVANLEGLYWKGHKVSKTFSEQMLVDCDTNDSGCNGGLMDLAFDWLKDNGGIEDDTDYPYKGRKQTCAQDTSKFVPNFKVTGYEMLGEASGDWYPCEESDMVEFLYKTGPLSVALNATPVQFYSKGILDPSSCSTSGINHAVTLVGYGNESGKDYWILKNSWGSSWGESGYFRLVRGKEACGINYYVITATVDYS